MRLYIAMCINTYTHMHPIKRGNGIPALQRSRVRINGPYHIAVVYIIADH